MPTRRANHYMSAKSRHAHGDDTMDFVPGDTVCGESLLIEQAATVAIVGAGCRIRTRDLLITNQLLYQLS
jgi:hypothetical protein